MDANFDIGRPDLWTAHHHSTTEDSAAVPPSRTKLATRLVTRVNLQDALLPGDNLHYPAGDAHAAPGTGANRLFEDRLPSVPEASLDGHTAIADILTASVPFFGVTAEEVPPSPADATTAAAPPARALKQAPPDGMPVATWAAQALGFQADPIQTEILNTHTPRLILCCTRQWGKSSVAAVKALHLAAAKPGAFILIASASYKQSAELLRVIRRHAEKLLGTRCKGDGINRGAVVLPNDSRIVALPQSPDTVRGFAAVDVIIIDEAAFVETEMHDALSPMLATTNGQLWLLSSANSTAGEFYKIWRGNGPDWRKFKVTAPECPRISPAFLAAERAAKGEAVFNREYMCDFTAVASKGVAEDVVDDAFRGDVPAVKLPR